jgi:hypothetical protein
MYRGGPYCAQLFVSELGLNADWLSKTFAKIKVDQIRGDVHQSAGTKRSLEVFYAPLVRFVCLVSAHGWLGIVLQEEIRPLSVNQRLPFPDDFKEILISRLKPFPEFLICFLPISGLA